jgi:hypothetical protein
LGNHPNKQDAMKYMLLIHQGTTPLPGTEEWNRLSLEEQAQVYADYQAINETRGFTPGVQLDSPETATTVRVEDGRMLTPTARSWSGNDPRAGLPRAMGARPSLRSSASSATSTSPRKPRRRPSRSRGALAARRVPTNPGHWLITTARNRAIDRIRRDRTLAAKTRLLVVPEAVEDDVDLDATFPDERLEPSST